MKKDNEFYYGELQTNMHIYSGALVIGDAFEVINALKKGNAYSSLFYKKNTFTNLVNEIKKDKLVKHISLTAGGGSWTPIFGSGNSGPFGGCITYYVDYASSILNSSFALPKACFSSSHKKILEKLWVKSSKNEIFKMSLPSKKMIFMESGDDIKIPTKKKNAIEIDYKKKSQLEVFNQLFTICHNPKNIKFHNFECPLDTKSLDFYVDNLQGNFARVLKVESLEKNLTWFSNYYAKYFTDEKNINKKQKLDKKKINMLKNWKDEKFKNLGIDPNLVDIEKEFTKAPIEKFKEYINEFGYLNGYLISIGDKP